MPSVRTLSLQLQKVSYKYPHSEKIALSEISYTFKAGATAIVGPNGAGKSTLVKLLTGLLAPTSGQIWVRLSDGVYVAPEKLHKGVLFQEPSHLYLTIRQNITMRFEKTPGEDERIYDALEKAGLSRAVGGLADGIDTLVGAGFGGQTDLSGGQWQRLALARLIYQDAPMIILDEPVASLDPEGERAVFELFAQVARSRIIIFTTHRYDSIPQNTKIVVLVDGVISESGTHEELLQKQHDYWSLYMSEASIKATPVQVAQSGHRGSRKNASNGHDRHNSAKLSLDSPERVPELAEPAGANGEPILEIVSDASAGPVVEMPDAEIDESEVIDEHITNSEPPPGAVSAAPVSTSSPAGKPAPRWKKYLVLASACLVLLLVAGLGAGFVLRSGGNGSASSKLEKHSTPAISRRNDTPTDIPGAFLYPSLAPSYAGTVADLMTQEQTSLRLANIQQSMGTIQGNFQGLGLAGPFKGSVTPSGQVQFIVTLYGGNELLLFKGTIKVGGDVVGTFAVLNQKGQPTGETGLWNIAAAS